MSRSLATLEPNNTLIAVIEMGQSSWLVAGIAPGIERHPAKNFEPDAEALLRLLRRWQEEAAKAGRTITRITVAFEAGRDGFWMAHWLRACGIEAYVIHPTSVAVPRAVAPATPRLNLALFVDRQHDGMAWRVDVEAGDVLDLLGEGRIVGLLEGADPMRL